MLVEKIDEVSKRLKQLDNKGSFESDDEVGFFFTYVKELQNEVRTLMGKPGESENDKSNKPVNTKER